jgi:competence protein ComEC
LAEARGITLQKFVLGEPGQRSWEEYYESLLVDPYDYYQEHLSGRTIFRYVQTHPDMDHMSGLHRFFWQGRVALLNFWDSDNTKDCAKEDFDSSRFAWEDWLVYRQLRAGRGPDGDSHKVLNKLREDTGQYWTDDEMTILSPSQTILDLCNDAGAWNNASYVLRIEYGGRTVILGGDSETMAWDEIQESFPRKLLKCDILKAPHHGRQSGYSESAAKAMDPEIVICSVGEKPETDASDEYAALGARVLSTRYYGTITATIWEDGGISVENTSGKQLAALAM